ncbi:MAG: hypothetical protein AAGD22_10520 [Verrucomicrobiota bacterium]
MMGTEKEWLANYSWEFVTAQNLLFCRSKNALHKPTSDGHEATRDLWNTRHLGVMALEEAVDLCRQCHRLAPFCFYNGNTFAAIIRDVVGRLELPVEKDAVVRSLARHIVAGVATGEEEEAFRVFCESLD